MQTPKPPKKVKCPEGYFRCVTPGKEYLVRDFDGGGFFTDADNGDEIYCLLIGCGHLDLENWIVTQCED